jgi:hypothetical protein
MAAVTVAATTAAAAATTATASTTATVPAAASTASTAAATARLTLAGLVDGERTAVERFTVELGDGGLRILVVCELDEGEPARLTGHTVGDDADADDLAAPCGARLAERGFVRVIREISNVDASSHASALPVRFGYDLSFPGDE